MPSVRVGIVTTARALAPGNAWQWACYHLSLGFAHLFVFLDSPDASDDDAATAATLEAAFSADQITVIRHSPALRAHIASHTALRRGLLLHYDAEVMARQIFFAEVALQLARGVDLPVGPDGTRAAGHAVDWLLHIDAYDELFFPGRPAGSASSTALSIAEHFDALETGGFTSAVYINYEPVYERASDASFFGDARLFRRNRATFADNERLTELARDWRKEKHVYWFGYWVGKSAVRVSNTVRPHEVTTFFVPQGDRRAVFDGPLILHFINPTARQLRLKYGMLGDFPDTVWGASSSAPESATSSASMRPSERRLSTHTALRDMVRNMSPKELEARFREWHFIGASESALEKWASSGLLAYIPWPGQHVSAMLQCAAKQVRERKLPALPLPSGPTHATVPFAAPAAAQPNRPTHKSVECGELRVRLANRPMRPQDSVHCFAAIPCCQLLEQGYYTAVPSVGPLV
jgi:hypothetical protein